MFVGLFLLRFVYNQISELTRRKRKWALECVQSISRLLFIDISHLFIWSKFLVNIGWNIQRKVLLVFSLTCYLVLLALVYQVKNLPKFSSYHYIVQSTLANIEYARSILDCLKPNFGTPKLELPSNCSCSILRSNFSLGEKQFLNVMTQTQIIRYKKK